MYTNATVVIAQADQEAAQIDFPGSFVSQHYLDEEGADPEVCTHLICSGLWTNSDLDFVVNEATWGKKVMFGELGAVLTELNLKPVQVVQVAVDETEAEAP